MISFFKKRALVNVNIRFYSGIHRDLKLENYDLGRGIIVQITESERLKSILRRIAIPDQSGCIYFINGKRAGLSSRLKENDEISCFRPSGGG